MILITILIILSLFIASVAISLILNKLINKLLSPKVYGFSILSYHINNKQDQKIINRINNCIFSTQDIMIFIIHKIKNASGYTFLCLNIFTSILLSKNFDKFNITLLKHTLPIDSILFLLLVITGGLYSRIIKSTANIILSILILFFIGIVDMIVALFIGGLFNV